MLILTAFLTLMAFAHQPVEMAQPAARKLEQAGLCSWAVAMYRSNEYATIDVSDLLVAASGLSDYAGRAIDRAAVSERGLAELGNRFKLFEGKIRDSADIERQFRRYADGRFASVVRADLVDKGVAALRDSLAAHVREALDSARVAAIARKQVAAMQPGIDSMRARLRAVEAELAGLKATPDDAGGEAARRAPGNLRLYRDAKGGVYYVGVVDTAFAVERAGGVRGQLLSSRSFEAYRFDAVVARPCNLGIFVGAKVLNPGRDDVWRESATPIDFSVRTGTDKTGKE